MYIHAIVPGRSRKEPQVSEQPARERISISITWWVRPLFLLFGITPGRAFVEVGPDQLRVRLGLLFDRAFPRAAVSASTATRVPWYCGPGVHLGTAGRLFVTGAFGPASEIAFAEPQPVAWLYGRRTRRLVVSTADADRLSRLLEAGGGSVPA
jgi:hypothetical protein